MSSTSIESKSDSEEFEDAIDTLEIHHQTPQTEELDAQQITSNLNLNQQKPPKFIHQPSIPPPLGPPPPLPEQFLQNPKSPPPTQIPPPLPPRRPFPRNQSPSAALPSITVPEKTEIQTEKSNTDQQQSYGRQRGHTKTNSLDRGLISLAKCMKTGPFPPPTTSKSNSLTRGASPSDILPTVDEQDTQAQGVIQGVIQQVLLSDNISLADENDFNKEATTSSDISPEKKMENPNKIKENIIPVDDKIQLNSSTSQTIINRRKAKSTGGCSSTDEKSNEIAPAGLTKQKLIVPHYENLVEQSLPKESLPEISSKLEDEKKQKITTKGNSKKRIDEKQHRRSASDKSPTKMKTAIGHHQKQKSSTWEPNQKTGLLQKPESIDPITRDVERRISLKEKGNLSNTKQNDHNETNDASSSEEVFGQKHSAKEHIRRFARNYGTVASDYLRGTVQKVRQHAAILTKNTNKSGKIVGAENDSRDGASSVADSDELSLANCISESLPVPMTTPIGRRMRATNSAEPPNSSRPTSAATTSSTVGICRPKNVKKGPFDFEQLRLVQELNHEHTGAIWCIKFSDCGRLLATAGQDRNVRVWVLRSQLNYFTSLRERYGQEVGSNLDYSLMQHIGNMRPDLYESVVEEEKDDENGEDEKIGNGKEMDEKIQRNSNSSKGQGPKGSLASSSSSFSSRPQSAGGISTKAAQFQAKANSSSSCPSNFAIFSPKPFCVFRGHTADVLDLSWSPRNYFILSSGMDRTVKLWHLTRNECLCSFQHLDFVTCIAFMPKDDRYFISGSLDGKIRLWNIPEKRVAVWNEVEQVVKYITAIAFVKNGKFVVVGTYSGRCFFYSTDQLKYHTVIDARSSKAKNSRENDKTKITALGVHGDKLLVTSNDSRIRIYDLRDMDLCCKFKGAQIEQSHIRAAFSPDGKYIVSGSEDNFVYLWRTSSSTVRKDRNHAWERIRAHQTVVTTAAFAPKPQLILSWLIEQQQKMKMEPIASSTPEPSENNISPSPPKIATKAEKNGGGQSAKERYSNSVERPFLALASKLALPTANLTDIQLIRRSTNNRPLNASSLGYSSSMLSIASAATHQSVNETIGNGRDRRAMGDVIVSADLGGSLKIFVNAIRLQTGASNFFPY